MTENTIQTIKQKNREEFKKKVMCYCEEGKESDHTTSNPKIILSFLSVAEDNIIKGVLEMVEEMKEWRQCNDCFDNEHCKGKTKKCECKCVSTRKERMDNRKNRKV